MSSGRKRRGLLVLFIMILSLAAAPLKAEAAKVMIKSCALSASNKNLVEISASGASAVANSDGKYYLFAMMPYENQISKDSILLATASQKGTMNFRASLNLNSQSCVLYRKFGIAVRNQTTKKYLLVSNVRYITNAERLAKYTYSFPKAVSKKGLQVNTSMLSDAEDLRIRHASVNICINEFLAASSQKNSKSSYSYSYQGQTFWFRKSACESLDAQVKKLTEMGVVVSGILLLQESGGGSQLVAPAARGAGKAFYGFNTMTKSGVNTLAALMHFMGERYMSSGKTHGRIVNWIVGNEVNNYGVYNYLGPLSFTEYAQAYARSFRVVSTALRSVYSRARVYISLDHCWNILQPGGRSYTSKNMLDAFAVALKTEGDINWNLAFHPYPSPLTDPVFWDDKVTNDDTTQTVTMKNIGYLTSYLKNNFRKDVRVILSEQGFTSKIKKTTNEKLQAAAFAYAYYITEFNDKIDSFIMNRHVDNVVETKQGLNLGLWNNKKGYTEYASDKKVIYDVFKYIDSASSKSVSEFALKYIGASSWSSKIPGFSWSRFNGMGAYNRGNSAAISKVSGTKAISNNVKYSYNGKVKKSGSRTVVSVKTGLNPNLYQGAGWVFSKKLDFTSRTSFTCKINITGMKEKYAHVRIRFFSGRNIYEAAGKVQGNKTKTLSVNLSKWKYRKTVDKIQIWVRPNGRTAWKKGGKITVSALKQAKSTKK